MNVRDNLDQRYDQNFPPVATAKAADATSVVHRSTAIGCQPGANFKMSRTILVHLSTLRMQKSSMNIDIGGQDEDNRGSNVSLNRRMLLL